MNAIQNEQGLVDQLDNLTSQSLIKSWELAKKKEELQQSDLYKEIQELESEISSIKKQDTELRELWKELMIQKWAKKFEALNWTIVQLNKKPWKLIIEKDAVIPEEYKKEKVTVSVDKKSLKEDVKEWTIIDWVSISEDYSLVIKHK